jgi:hypothetical protein
VDTDRPRERGYCHVIRSHRQCPHHCLPSSTV